MTRALVCAPRAEHKILSGQICFWWHLLRESRNEIHVCIFYVFIFQKRIFGNVKFDEHHGAVSVLDGLNQPLIEGHIGVGIFHHDDHPNHCRNRTDTESEKCLEWHRKARLAIKHLTYEDKPGVHCYK